MTELETLTQALAALEAQRPVLGDAMVDAMQAPARAKLAALQAQNAPQAAPVPPAPTSQRKHVTVLFADISGFTALSETLDAEEVRDTMNALWAKLDAVITAHGGKVDKHIGDAVMALWGTDNAQEDDPERAIKAALAMQAVIKAEGDEQKAEGSGQKAVPLPSAFRRLPSALQMRIGLNTGPVLLGAVGSNHEFTAMGDTVNVASRLEHAAPVGGILIAHDTYRQVRGVFDVLAQAPLIVKGKAEPLQVYLVERLKPRAFRTGSRGVEGVETPMVGRAAELAKLQAAWRVVLTEQRMQTALVVADAGLGKSRLLFEFYQWMETHADVEDWRNFPERRFWLFRGRATEALRHTPYGLLRDMLFRRFEIREDEPLESACAKLVTGVRRFLPHDPKVEEKAHFIGYLVGLDFSTSPYLRGILHEAQQIRDRAFHYLTQFFAGATQLTTVEGGDSASPIAMYFDDVHWADEGSLAALAYLAERCRALPILLLGLTRPTLFETHAPWAQGWAETRLELHALDAADARALVDAILRHAPAVPEGLRVQIVAQAEGNPFYLEEIIKMLIDEKVLRPAEPTWDVALDRLTQLHIPPTLTGVLQARLDRLTPAERETLQRASVIGRVFWAQAVAALRPDPTAPPSPVSNLQSLISNLHHRELIFPRPASAFVDAEEYLFKHAVLREVTYETVLKKLRRVYHAQAAAWLVAQSGARADEFAALIAEHYELAGDTAQAAIWHGRAGKQAEEAYAPETAIQHYQQALALHAQTPTPEPALTWPWYKGLGETLFSRARYAEALEAFTTLRTLAEQAGDGVAQAQAWNGLSDVQDAQGHNQAALESATQAEQVARTAGPAGQVELATALYRKGWAFFRLGEATAALAHGEQALALSVALGEVARHVQAESLKLLGSANWLLSRLAQSREYQQQALALFRALGNRQKESVLLNNLGVTAYQRGEYAAAIEHYQAALTIAQEIGSRDTTWTYLSNLAGARVEQGDYAAEADLRQLLAEIGTTKTYFLPFTYYWLAQACAGQGCAEEAHAAAKQALALAQATGEKQILGMAWRMMGHVGGSVTDEGGRMMTPADCFAESLRLLIEIGMGAEQARTLRVWARHELAHGEREAGERRWAAARALFEQLGLEAEVARMEQMP